MNDYNMFLEEVKGLGIPSPFFIRDNKLYRVNEKNNQEEFISRQVPYITTYFDDVEKNNVQYELKWYNEPKLYKEVVSATALATKREVIMLANKGFSSNDRNARFLIEYFDLFLEKNSLKRSQVVSHLGYVGRHFVHPLLEATYHIVPPDEGELQRLNAIQCEGTAQEWIENIMEPLYDNPKAVFPVIVSFASVLFKQHELSSILVDISGISSSGKTTVQKACASVWGKPSIYISSMLSTKVAIERMAGFLNAFPLILDDTNTADDPKTLQSMIYMFGNGWGKMRGSTEGSRGTSSWQSAFITTGENNILEYTDAQGSAARVIPITNFQLKKNDSFFASFNKSLERYHGSIGMEFIQRWQKNSQRFKGRLQQLEESYQSSAANNIMRRLASHFAFIVFVAEVLNELFIEEGMKIPIDDLGELFLVICSENDHTDRAKSMLIEILEELQSNRNFVYEEYEPKNAIHAIVKEDGFYLTIDYVKRKLNLDVKQIREAWLNQQLTVQQKNRGKRVDYKNIDKNKKTYRVIQVSHEFLEDQGFNFFRNSY